MRSSKAQRGTLAQRLWRRVRSSLVGATLIGLISALVHWLHEATKGVTSKYFAARPASPSLLLIDARCNRARLKFQTSPTSIFNVDEHQIAYAKAESESDVVNWTEDKWTQLQHRVLAPLEPGTHYLVRARSQNAKGQSSWGPTLPLLTLHSPVNGGAHCDGYIWTQNGIEASVSCSVDGHVRAKDVEVKLRPCHLYIACRTPSGLCVLIDDDLPDRVRSLSPEGASYWELEREGGTTTIRAILEKERPATNIKWGFWRSMFVGHPQIDTHVIGSDPHVKCSEVVSSNWESRFAMEEVYRDGLEQTRHRLGGIKASEVADLPPQLAQHYRQ